MSTHRSSLLWPGCRMAILVVSASCCLPSLCRSAEDDQTQPGSGAMNQWLKIRLERPVSQLNIDTAPTSTDTEGRPLPHQPKLVTPPEGPMTARSDGCPTQFGWACRAVVHHPVYFEDCAVERCGGPTCGCLQPVVSGARFCLAVPLLPLAMVARPPCTCVCDRGECPCAMRCAPHPATMARAAGATPASQSVARMDLPQTTESVTPQAVYRAP